MAAGVIYRDKLDRTGSLAICAHRLLAGPAGGALEVRWRCAGAVLERASEVDKWVLVYYLHVY